MRPGRRPRRVKSLRHHELRRMRERLIFPARNPANRSVTACIVRTLFPYNATRRARGDGAFRMWELGQDVMDNS